MNHNQPTGTGQIGLSQTGLTKLSALDAVYLDAETPETPMHMACLVFVDAKPLRSRSGRLRTNAIVRRVESRWAHVSCVHSRLTPATSVFEPHRWENVEDISRSIETIHLPAHSNDREVLDRCAELLKPLLPHRRPLWRLYILDGVSDDRVAFLFQVHHALCDGQGAAILLSALMDATNAEHQQISPDRLESKPEPANRFTNKAQNLLTHVLDVAKQGGELVEGVAALATEARLRPETSLNTVVSLDRRLDLGEIDFDLVRDVSHTLKVTVNDVILSLVAGAIGAMLRDRGDDVSKLVIEALVPISTRTTDEVSAPGNHTAVLQVPLPVGVVDPVLRVRSIHRATATRKRHHVASAIALAETLASFVPNSLLHPLSKFFVQHQNLVNIAVTNLRGPTESLYFMGARVRQITPFLPLAQTLPVSFAVASYGNKMTLGVVSDPDSCPDAPTLPRHFVEALAMLTYAAEIAGESDYPTKHSKTLRKGRKRTVKNLALAKPASPSRPSRL
jgi:diacylglycerol O-acyltransferase / wax synthase